MKTNLTIEQRALTACREYARVSALIKKLTRDIGEVLSRCPGTDEAPISDEAYQPTHLRAFYHQGDIANELAWAGYTGPDVKAEFEACAHCVSADRLVKERKAARLSLGAAKRQIAKLGRAAA